MGGRDWRGRSGECKHGQRKIDGINTFGIAGQGTGEIAGPAAHVEDHTRFVSDQFAQDFKGLRRIGRAQVIAIHDTLILKTRYEPVAVGFGAREHRLAPFLESEDSGLTISSDYT